MSGIRTDVNVAEASEADQPMLRRLMQLYCYDFSGFFEMPLNEDGTFGDPAFIEEQFGAGHRTFVIRGDSAISGFAVVTERSYLSGTAGVNDMAQFFVIRGRRRGGVGEAAASQLFTLFSGPWEVRVMKENTAALGFWRSIIDRYTGGSFAEGPETDSPLGGTLFRFESSGD